MARSAAGRASGGSRGVVVSRVRRGGGGVFGVQRARLLSSAVRVLAEEGFEGMSVARVAGGARVSRRTFYDVFEDREDCFLAVFEDAVVVAEGVVGEAFEGEGGCWCERVRAGLGALLCFLDERPELRVVLVRDALVAGPRVLACRAGVLERVGLRLHEEAIGGVGRRGRDLPVLVGEAVVNGVFGLVHARLAERSSRPLFGLLGELMGVIVLAYEGPGASRRELERPVLKRALGASRVRGLGLVGRDPLEGLGMRLTYRTVRVLSAIGGCPGVSNRGVGGLAGVSDQGQASRLLRRLEGLGLIENSGGGHSRGERNAWRLTARGREVERAVVIPADGGGDRQGGGGWVKGVGFDSDGEGRG
jgi:AcrR family transcriptional regulator